MSQRQKHNSLERLEVVRKYLLDQVPGPDLCGQYGLDDATLQSWVHQFAQRGLTAFPVAPRRGFLHWVTSIDYRKFELTLFAIVSWTVSALSLLAIVTKAIWGHPSSAPVQALLVLAVAASALAIFVPRAESYVLSRVGKVSFAGVEVELEAAVGTALEWLKYDEIPPPGTGDLDIETVVFDHPFPSVELTGLQRYYYERLSQKLYLAFNQVKDPNQLDPGARENYRKLINFVGTTAFRMKHFSKGLDILQHLQVFKDRDLDGDEHLWLGTLYLWAADEIDPKSKRWEYWGKAVPLLKAAMDRNPYEVKIPYNLGWALLSLGVYEDGVTLMNECIRLRASIKPWAKWNAACGLKRLGKEEDTLKALEEIPPGTWWNGIEKDDWLLDPRNNQFTERFERLCASKKLNSAKPLPGSP